MVFQVEGMKGTMIQEITLPLGEQEEAGPIWIRGGAAPEQPRGLWSTFSA